MNRTEFEKYINEFYATDPEYPFEGDPVTAVFRHSSNKKWFAIVMHIPIRRLGIDRDGEVDVVNLKCEPLYTVSLIHDEGIHKAYHMNKTHWITVRLDGSVEADKIKWLLDMSFDLTGVKRRKK